MENQTTILNQEGTIIDNDIEEQKIISLWRFIFLSVISLGAYEIWWMYKAWRFYQQKDKSDINPVARAIFSIFFINSLLGKILSFAKEKGYSENYSSAGLATGFIVINLLSSLPDPFWVISILSFLFLIPAFTAFNFAKLNSNDFQVKEQDSFNGRQIALIVIGAILWFIIIIGLIEGE
ncbi:MAG: hypothetical protein J7604_00430 [Sporocytophaga sp.]|uniref:hypothetical protein n=1 Tax=Sporocytophaga sp. TaxID=2231183 RepID=UPI001B04BDC3|nr:hypothetical protein [Sporocytophaga sp.]MBO9698635.1 hypothetical protein [Sporocytophaga sp.]